MPLPEQPLAFFHRARLVLVLHAQYDLRDLAVPVRAHANPRADERRVHEREREPEPQPVQPQPLPEREVHTQRDAWRRASAFIYGSQVEIELVLTEDVVCTVKGAGVSQCQYACG